MYHGVKNNYEINVAVKLVCVKKLQFLSESKKPKEKRKYKLKCASGEDRSPNINTCEANNDLPLCQPS